MAERGHLQGDQAAPGRGGTWTTPSWPLCSGKESWGRVLCILIQGKVLGISGVWVLISALCDWSKLGLLSGLGLPIAGFS